MSDCLVFLHIANFGAATACVGERIAAREWRLHCAGFGKGVHQRSCGLWGILDTHQVPISPLGREPNLFEGLDRRDVFLEPRASAEHFSVSAATRLEEEES